MNRKEVLQQRLKQYYEAYSKLWDAYFALVDGGVKSYMIDDRQLTRLDLPELKKEIGEFETKIDALEKEIEGRKPRKAVGVVIRDW